MSRSGASALSFDEGWDWTDPEPRGAQRGDLAYYDWSQDEDFVPRRRRLRAVPDLPALAGTTPGPARAPATPPPVRAAAEAPDRVPAPLLDPPPSAAAARRTVTITGRGAERHMPARRPTAGTARMRTKPDRIAMWAVLLGILMILAAATSAHAAVLH